MTEVKKEVTTGNIWSMATTLITLATMLVTVTLAYGRLSARDELHSLEIANLKMEIAERKTAERAMNDALSTMRGDIRVIRQILEGSRTPN